MTLDDLARMLTSLAGATHTDLDAETFDSRLRIQKAVYLFKALGSPAAQRYCFTDYFHGPYAPNLAKEYYALKDAGKLKAAVSRASATRAPSGNPAVVADAIRRGNAFLEAVTTLHSIVTRNKGASVAQIRGRFKTVKPHLDSRFEEAWRFLKDHQLIAGRT